MPGQLDLVGAPRADAEERPAARGALRRALSRPLRRSRPSSPRNLPPSTPPVDPPAPAVAAALAAIAELIAEPERWCQGCSARDAQGRPTVPGSAGAARLSAFGAFALLRFDGRLSNADALRLWLVLDGATPDGRRFARWHDDKRTTHAEVLALLKRARGEP